MLGIRSSATWHEVAAAAGRSLRVARHPPRGTPISDNRVPDCSGDAHRQQTYFRNADLLILVLAAATCRTGARPNTHHARDRTKTQRPIISIHRKLPLTCVPGVDDL